MTELVYINNNHALTSSLLVAEKFGKEHSDVLKAIRNLITPKGGNPFSLIIRNLQCKILNYERVN